MLKFICTGKYYDCPQVDSTACCHRDSYVRPLHRHMRAQTYTLQPSMRSERRAELAQSETSYKQVTGTITA